MFDMSVCDELQQLPQKKPNNPINSSYWNHVLYFFGLGLFTESNPSPEKFENFLSAVVELKFKIDPTVKIRRQTIRQWYELYKPDLERVNHLRAHRFLEPILVEIGFYGHRVDILVSLVKILKTDGGYNRRALALMRKTALFWKIPPVDYGDLNYTIKVLKKLAPGETNVTQIHQVRQRETFRETEKSEFGIDTYYTAMRMGLEKASSCAG